MVMNSGIDTNLFVSLQRVIYIYIYLIVNKHMNEK